MNTQSEATASTKGIRQIVFNRLIYIVLLGLLPGIVHHQLPDRFTVGHQEDSVNKQEQGTTPEAQPVVEVVDVAEKEQIGDTVNSGDTQAAVNDTEIEQLTVSYGAPGAGYSVAPVSAPQYGSGFHFPSNRRVGSGGHHHSGGGSHRSSSGGGSAYHNAGGFNSASSGGFGGGFRAPSRSGSNNSRPGTGSLTSQPVENGPSNYGNKAEDQPVVVASNDPLPSAVLTPGTTTSGFGLSIRQNTNADALIIETPPSEPSPPAVQGDPADSAIRSFRGDTFLSLFLAEIGGTLVDGQEPYEQLINTGTDTDTTLYDQVNVFGVARISNGASIIINLKDTYTPEAGDFYDLITGDSIITNLSELDFQLPTLEGLGFEYDIVSHYDRLTGTVREALRFTVIVLDTIVNTSGLQSAGNDFQILNVGNPIPEPASWLLMGLGILILAGMRRYRKI